MRDKYFKNVIGENNMKRRIFTVLLTIAMMLAVIGCGEKEPELTGKWIPEDVTVIDNSEAAFPANIELFSDGTGSGEGMSLSWIAENERIKFDIKYMDISFNYTYDYKLSDTKLILTDSETGDSAIYIRE